MNEMSKNLLVQAGFKMRPTIINIKDGVDWSAGSHGYDICLERLIELVVSESVRYLNEDYQRDYDIKWRKDLSDGIKQHFGIEQ